MDVDALSGSHAIEQMVVTLGDISSVFDDIVYSKAAAVIRMLYLYMGSISFRDGVSLYLERFSFGNAKSDDLISCLEHTSGLSLKSMITTWTKQTGFPIVMVEVVRGMSSTTIRLDQQRFSQKLDNSSQIWIIPVATITHCAEKDPHIVGHLMSAMHTEFIVRMDPNCLIKVNHESAAFIHVHYKQQEEMDRILDGVRRKILTPIDRSSVLLDMHAVARAGIMSTTRVLEALRNFFQDEGSHVVWSVIISVLDDISLIVDDGDTNLYNVFAVSLMLPVATILGWNRSENESRSDSKLRPLILTQLIKYKHLETISEAVKRFESASRGLCDIPDNLQVAVYASALDTEHGLRRLIDLYRKSNDHQQQIRVLKAMGMATDGQQVQQIVEFGLSRFVEEQDKSFIINSIAVSSVTGQMTVWAAMKAQFMAGNVMTGPILLDRVRGLTFVLIPYHNP